MTEDRYAKIDWIDHEWLAQVVVVLSYRWAGVNGKLLKFACVVTIVLFSSIAIGESRASPGTQQIILFTEALAVWAKVQCRLELFFSGIAFLASHAAGSPDASGFRTSAARDAVSVISASFHDRFSAGLAVLGVYSGAEAIRDAIGPRGRGLHGLPIRVTLSPLSVSAPTLDIHSCALALRWKCGQ
jgi:hypothetical protein